MKDKLLKIINTYGAIPQLKYFQSEVFELNEAILDYEKTKEKTKDHIAEEIADVLVMLNQFVEYYEIDKEQIRKIMKYKINRQLERIANNK